jgi:hypothetical protein
VMEKPAPFVLKPEDMLSTPAIALWLAFATRANVNAVKLLSAQEHLDAFIMWQKANPDKIKVPD